MIDFPELYYRLQILRTSEITGKDFLSIIDKYKTAKNAVFHLKNFYNFISMEQIKKEVDDTYNFGANFLCFDHELFPKLLLEKNPITPILVYKGNINILKEEKIAIVGSRIPTISGLRICENIIKTLPKKITIVSGMALGIDYMAHKTALENNYNSIGIITGGINNIYPKKNQKLFEQMYEKKSLIIAYNAINSKMSKYQFLERNKLIVHISNQIFIIEAKIKSGTFSTANYSILNNFMTYIAPGNIYEENYSGSNLLIQKYKNNDNLQLLINKNFPKNNIKIIPYEKTPMEIIQKYTKIPIKNLLIIVYKLFLKNKITITNHREIYKNLN